MKPFTPERLYGLVMWILSLVLAGFLVGFGGLIIGDVPVVENELEIEQFVDRGALDALQAQENEQRLQRQQLAAERDIARAALDDAREAYRVGNDAFQSWVDAREATDDPQQDPELLRRSAELDRLRETLSAAQARVSGLEQQIAALDRSFVAIGKQNEDLYDAARPKFERARFMQEARIFGIRLALTLPLILIAGWMVRTRRRSRYWPLMRGFVLFALFTFFVELVPYLPEYGGYVRYGVGILLTLVIGRYLAVWMRGFLERRRKEREVAEPERRRALDADAAVAQVSKGVCPGCERPILTVDDVKPDFCVHCGLKLFENCPACGTRKQVFHRYCLKCGTPSETQGVEPVAGAAPDGAPA